MAQQSKNSPRHVKSFRAGAAVAAYRIVKHGADSEHAVHAAAAADASFGVTIPGVSPNLGALAVAEEIIDVATEGIAHVEYGGAVALGAPLTSDAQGRAVTAAAGNRIIGIAQAAGALGEIGAVQIAPGVL